MNINKKYNPHYNRYEYTTSNGIIHNINDQPAIEYDFNGRKEWLQYGQLHRDNDLPAIIDPLYSMWFQHGIAIKYKAYDCDYYYYWYQNKWRWVPSEIEDYADIIQYIQLQINF